MVEEKLFFVACPACHSKYKVSGKLMGKKIPCKKCNHIFVVANPEPIAALPLIGKLALKFKFVEEAPLLQEIEQYKTEHAEDSGLKLHNYLIDQGVISHKNMTILLAAKEAFLKKQQEKKFGALAIQMGIITSEDLKEALLTQADQAKNHQTPALLGDILITLGALAPRQRDRILVAQNNESKQHSSELILHPDLDGAPATEDKTASTAPKPPHPVEESQTAEQVPSQPVEEPPVPTSAEKPASTAPEPPPPMEEPLTAEQIPSQPVEALPPSSPKDMEAAPEEEGNLPLAQAPEADSLPDDATPPPDKPEAEKKKDQVFTYEGLELTITDGGLNAYMRMLDETPLSQLTIEDVKYFLQVNNVTYGIVDDALINGFLKSKIFREKKFHIAKGIPPQYGQDATIKYLFDTNYLKVGAVSGDGQIDFKDRGKIPHVDTDDLLAEKTPMTPSSPGVNVYGFPLEVNETKDSPLRCGKGVKLSDDGLKAFSANSGQPKVTFGGKLFVFNDLTIEEDVGYKTGHIDFDGNVIVKGAIQSGFKVKAENLIAREIQNAEIETTGDITVSDGINGAVIKTKGNIQAKYINKARISAYGNVVAQKQIIDTTIETSGMCSAPRGKLISSTIAAQKGVEALHIGTELSEPCRLKVGTHTHIDKEILKIQKKIDAQLKDKETLDKDIEALNIEDKKIHQNITTLAQVQDQAMRGQRTVQDKIKAIKQAGKKDELNNLMKLAGELQEKSKATDNALNNMFNAQDQVQEKIELLKVSLDKIDEAIAELKLEKKGLTEWSREQQSLPVVKAYGVLFAKTTISANHASLVVDNTLRNYSAREKRNTDPNVAVEWEIVTYPN